jgi:hypothetical protein
MSDARRVCTLDRLPEGTRFQAVEAPDIIGRLVKVNYGSCTVELEGRATIRDFETADHEWVRIHSSGKRRTNLARAVRVVVLPEKTAEVQ